MGKLWFAKVGWWCAALYLLSLCFVVFQGGKTSLMLFVMLNALGLYLLLGRWSGIGQVQGLRTLEGAAAGLSTVTAGARLRVKLQVHIPGYWPLPYVIVRERLTRTSGSDSQDYELSFVPDYRRRGTIEYETAPLRRGRYVFQQTSCSTRDIFGLFEHHGAFEQPLEIRVAPRVLPLRDWRLLRKSRVGAVQQKVASIRSRETTQIDGVREFLYGDRLSRIHWNATARTGEWKSKEYEREALPRFVLVLDRRAAAYSSPEQFELAVSATASLVDLAVRLNMPVGFLSAGRERLWFGVGRQSGTREEVMDHLIDAEADGAGSLGEALGEASERFEPGAYLILVSPLTEEDVAGAFETLEARRQVASHVHIAGRFPEQAERAVLERWRKLLLAKGWDLISISRLEDLLQATEVGTA